MSEPSNYQTNHQKLRGKSEYLVIALLPSRRRAEAQELLPRRDAECASLLDRTLRQERVCIGVKSAIAALPVAWGVFEGSQMAGMPAPVALMSAVILGLTTGFCLNVLPSRLEKAAWETLAQGENTAYIGLCLDVLLKQSLDARLRELLQEGLARLLPQGTQETFDRLTPSQRRSLYGILDLDHRESNQKLQLAVLNALQLWGDRDCLGIVYCNATKEETLPVFRTATRQAVEQISLRLDFGSLRRIPEYVDHLRPLLHPSSIDYQKCAVCVMALRRLVPQLTPANIQNVLSESERDRLYNLLAERTLLGNYRYGKDELFLEIIAAARRLQDTRAIRAIQTIASSGVQSAGAHRLRIAAGETLALLEAQVAREKESRVLLRGATAPASPEQELLRAARPSTAPTSATELLRAGHVTGTECEKDA